MTKNKKGGFIKVAVISAVCIGVFSAAYIGINSFVFANATNRAESVPTATITADVPMEVSPVAIIRSPQTSPPADADTAEYAPEFWPPTLTITINPNQHYVTMPHNAISHQEAAQLGARYIWDMLGECIDGMYVSLLYTFWPSHTRPFVIGDVTETRQDGFGVTENNERRFAFTLDAATGERMSIHRLQYFDMSAETLDVLRQADNSDFFSLRLDNTETPDQLDDFVQTAMMYAGKHFAGMEIVGAEFIQVFASGFGLDENGELIVTTRQLNFEVTAESGLIADIAIDEATGQLRLLCTANNYIVPGFMYEAVGGLG